MTTDPNALTEAEREELRIACQDWDCPNCGGIAALVVSILSARAAALRADIARDLVERLNKANREIEELAARTPIVGSVGEHIRLRGKAEGVRLARSYVEEMLR